MPYVDEKFTMQPLELFFTNCLQTENKLTRFVYK